MDFYGFHYIFMWCVMCNEWIGDYISDFFKKGPKHKFIEILEFIFNLLSPIFTCPNVLKQILLEAFNVKESLEFLKYHNS
jgi:hypothetical protein